MLYPILLAISCIIFLLMKFSNLGVRLSDTNIYFYMADQITKGAVLYKDMFLTNLPLFPYVSVLYYFLTGKEMTLYYATSALEAVGVTVLIYLILKHLKLPGLYALLGSVSYLFSFSVLATSDHQTGIFLASLFATGSFYLYLKKKFLWAGILLGLMVTTKAYFAPVALSIILYSTWQLRKQVWPMMAGFAGAVAVVMLPTLLFAFPEFWQQTFGYSLHRPAGIDKGNVLMFFLKNSPILVISGLYTLYCFKKYKLEALIIVLCCVFIALYKDIYFFYLNMLLPFLAIMTARMFFNLSTRLSKEFAATAALSIVGLFLLLNIKTYTESFRSIQKVQDISKLVSVINVEKPDVLYGLADLTPALAYLSNTPMLLNVIDTNENLYIRKVYSAETMSKAAIQQKTLFIAYGAEYPEHDIHIDIISQIVTEQFAKSCKVVYSQPVYAEGATNRINLLRCYK